MSVFPSSWGQNPWRRRRGSGIHSPSRRCTLPRLGGHLPVPGIANVPGARRSPNRMTLLPIHAHRERPPATPVCLRTGFRALFVALALSACASSPSGASTLPDRFSDQVVTGGLNDPVGFAFTPDGRMVVAERAGAVRFIVE